MAAGHPEPEEDQRARGDIREVVQPIAEQPDPVCQQRDSQLDGTSRSQHDSRKGQGTVGGASMFGLVVVSRGREQ
jgi:hypothetical protein